MAGARLPVIKDLVVDHFAGNCIIERECEGDCPKEISFANIARLNREVLAAKARPLAGIT